MDSNITIHDTPSLCANENPLPRLEPIDIVIAPPIRKPSSSCIIVLRRLMPRRSRKPFVSAVTPNELEPNASIAPGPTPCPSNAFSIVGQSLRCAR